MALHQREGFFVRRKATCISGARVTQPKIYPGPQMLLFFYSHTSPCIVNRPKGSSFTHERNVLRKEHVSRGLLGFSHADS